MLLAQDICSSKSIANIVVKIVVVGTTYCASAVVFPVFSQHMKLPKKRVHNRVLKSRFFFFSIPPSRPFLRPDPDPAPFFLRDFRHFLLDHWHRRYDLRSDNCQFWWSRFSTSQLATITLFSVLLNYFFVLASVHVYLDTLSPVFLELGRLMLSVCLTKIRLLCC